jgi:hypothetical protein
MLRNLLCMIGLHFYKWGEIESEEWVSHSGFSGLELYEYSRNYIDGCCQCCKKKKRKYLS